MTPIRLDAREMEHPQPLEMAVGILKTLDHEHFLYMVHRKNPIPLLELAKGQGFSVLSKEVSKGLWHILIAPNADIELNGYLDV